MKPLRIIIGFFSRRLRAGLLCLPVFLSACAAPTYYAQAVSGHYDLMSQREDVETLLRDPDTDSALALQLRLAESILAFASDELGLPSSEAYRQYVATGRDAITWNVVAAPEFSLSPRRWCFLVAGCVPYRGYFNEAEAHRFATRLRQKGFDVSVSPAIAYSTLSWFDDPLLDTMFHLGDARLAGVLFHELAHRALYVKGDTTFNESFAGFVESMGVERWLRAYGSPEERARWQQAEAAALRFTEFLLEQRGQLAALYALPLQEREMRDRKQAFFVRLREDYRYMVAVEWGGIDYLGGWFDGEINNARFALVSSYHGGRCAFSRLYREAGGDFRRFMDLATRISKLEKNQRREWLQRDCEVIAPTVDL